MTLPLGNRMDYTGNGAVDTYSYTFKILDEDDLTVAVRDPDTGVETILTKTTHYTVTGVGSAGGGSVALVNGSFDWLDSGGDLDTGWILTILRELPLLQETDLSTQSSFLPETIEDQMDRSIMIAQQQQDALDRSIRLPVTVDPDTFDPEVPASVVGEAGAILKVNSTGDGWTVGTADLPNATVTPYMETLLDDANAAAARTTLGLDGASGVVATGDIAALAVTTAKILDANVTTAKLSSSVQAALAPAGLMAPYAGSSAPTGWLLCDGSAINRTTYADLYSAIGTTYGSGDGSTTFNLPDMRGRMSVGAGAGSLTESVAAASVNTGSDYFTVSSNNTKWVTGMPVVLTTTGGLPSGLSLATTYYVIRASATTIKFASTLANAQNGTAIDLTTQGTGTHTVTHTLTTRTLGERGGEETHAMSSTEILLHTHPMSYDTEKWGASPGNVFSPGGANPTSTDSAGGNAAMNVMNPFLALNFIIKT